MVGIPAFRALSTGDVKAFLSTTAMAMPSAFAETAELMALTISGTLESFEPVHWYEAARSAQASAAPYCVGVKNGFVVTWLTNTNFHFGVSGKSPTPLPDLLLSLLLSAEQADSKAAAAAEALSIPAPLNSRRLASPFRLSVSTASSTCGSIFFMITPARSAHAARYFERRSALL